MRPFLHPAAEEIRPDAILHALADPVRATIFAEIAGLGCARTCSGLASLQARAVPKSSLSQHVRVLREAGLIRSERRGVEMRNTSRAAEVEQRFPGLLDAILRAYAVGGEKIGASPQTPPGA